MFFFIFPLKAARASQILGPRHGVQGVTIVSIRWCSQQGLHERQNLVLQIAVANNGTSVSPLHHTSVTYKKKRAAPDPHAIATSYKYYSCSPFISSMVPGHSGVIDTALPRTLSNNFANSKPYPWIRGHLGCLMKKTKGRKFPFHEIFTETVPLK
jgi:hypothetical protein